MRLKPILSSFLLSLAVGFMFFIFEPISLFVNNPDDFWFSVSQALPILIGAFAGCAAIIFMVLFGFYLFCNKIIKKPKVFEYALVIFVAIFLITYIQGNFLSTTLPGLTGNAFSWQDYPIESVISIILWVVVFVAATIAVRKFSIEKVVSYAPAVIGIVLAMLSVGLVSTLISNPDVLVAGNETPRLATYNNYNITSDQQNFYILLVDTVDSKSFDDLLRDNPDYQTAFTDFTYYPDTLSYYAFTRNSVPQIISGIPYHNELSYADYLTKAYDESAFLSEASGGGYRLNLYENKINIPFKATGKFDNYVEMSDLIPIKLIKRIVRFDLYKYLPYPLKSLANIELCRFDPYLITELSDNSNELYDWSNRINYDIYNDEDLETTSDKMFSFIHLEGSHDPFDVDENMQEIENKDGTYSQKNTAVFKMIKAFIDRLKRSGVYDNSVIIVMSDHGRGTFEEYMTEDVDVRMRVNPILYIKGVGETHPELIRSDKPISYFDLAPAYSQLLQGQPSTELFAEVSYPRTRKILLYNNWRATDELYEYETDGAATDANSMKSTGIVYKIEE